MELFDLKPGPAVGTVLRYLKENYSSVEGISPQMEAEVRQRVLSARGLITP